MKGKLKKDVNLWYRRTTNSTFGTCGENYIHSMLPFLIPNQNGSLLPDFMSRAKNLSQRLFFLEVKSGESRPSGHIFLKEQQEVYPHTIANEFGVTDLVDDSPLQLDLLRKTFSKDQVVFYYSALERAKLPPEEVISPYNSIKIKFRDQFWFPYNFASSYFLAEFVRKYVRHQDSLRPVEEILALARKRLHKSILLAYTPDLDKTQQDFEGDKWDRQNCYFSDLEMLMDNEYGVGHSDETKRRIELLLKFYPKLKSMIRYTAKGPGQTKIHFLLDPVHNNFFRRKISHVIHSRLPVIDGLIEEREEAVKTLLPKFAKANKKEEGYIPPTEEEQATLTRLCLWKTKEDVEKDYVISYPSLSYDSGESAYEAPELCFNSQKKGDPF